MEIKELFDKLVACDSPEKMRRAMYDLGHKWFDYGSTMIAYRIGEYVVKHTRDGQKCHTPSAEALNNALVRRLWLTPLYQSEYVIVQFFCAPIRGGYKERRIVEIIERALAKQGTTISRPNHILHLGDLGRYKGKIKIFDAVLHQQTTFLKKVVPILKNIL